MSWRLGELASWAAAKGVLVWQADVALATLELYAAAIAPDSSALSHTCLGETRRSTACNEPSPTSSPSATASSATTDTAPLSTLVSRGAVIGQSPGDPKRTLLAAESWAQMLIELIELVGSRKNDRTP